MEQYKVYEPSQKAVYEEDGARAIVEVIGRVVEDGVERYQLKVISPLNASQKLREKAEDKFCTYLTAALQKWDADKANNQKQTEEEQMKLLE